MNKKKFTGFWSLIVGIVITVIGIIHNVFATGAYTFLIKKLPKNLEILAIKYTYMSTALGTAVICAGLLMIYASFNLKKGKKWAWNIALSVGTYMAVTDIAAIFMTFENLFIYIIIAASVSNIVLLLIFKKDFRS